MSGPKSARYRVDPHVLARAAQEAANRRVRKVEQRHLEVTAKAEALLLAHGEGVSVPDLGRPASDDVDVINRWVLQHSSLLDGVESQLGAILQRIRAAELVRAAVGDEGGLQARRVAPRTADSPSAPGGTTVATGQAEAGGPEIVQAVRSVVEKLDPDATEPERTQIDELAQRVLTATGTSSQTLFIELQARTQAVTRRADAHRRDVETARLLVTELDSLEGREAEAMRDTLERVARGESRLASSDADRVREIASRARADAERDHAATVLRQELERLGYEVHQGFQTAFATGGARPTYLSKAGAREHAVEVVHDENQLNLRVVRFEGAADPTADIAAEESWCRDFGDVTQAAQARGVELRLVSAQPAGAVPVEVVPQAKPQVRRTAPRPQIRQRPTP